MSDKYIMVSMDDGRSKPLADVLGSQTAKNILTLLSQKDASETDISSALNMPINTIEYNLKKLVASGLVEKKSEFFWSVKGKKIPMYKLSKKYIVIAPKNKSRVSGFFATLILSGIATALIRYYEISKTAVIQESLKASASSPMLEAENAASGASLGSIALWFLIGALFALIVLMILRKSIRR
jgi:DNA-binding transcriptional ArsR family regulator